MTRDKYWIDLATLPWKRGRSQVLAVADATEQWLKIFFTSLCASQHDEVVRLITLLRATRNRDKKRLISETETGLRQLEISFRRKLRLLSNGRSSHWTVPAIAAKIGLGYVQSTKLTDEIVQFQRAIEQTDMINVWDVFTPWRLCDAFDVTDVNQIPQDVRHSFEAIWLAGEFASAYVYAESWKAMHAA